MPAASVTFRRTVHHWLVSGLDLATGETRWTTEVHTGVPRSSHHLKNTFASETPVTDGELIYVTVRQRRPLCAWTSRAASGGRVSSRPCRRGTAGARRRRRCVHEGRVYLVVDNEDQSYLSALSAETGAELMAGSIVTRAATGRPRSSGRTSVRTEIVTTGTDMVRSYDLDGQPPLGARRHVERSSSRPRPHGARPPLHRVRLSRRLPPTGVCDPSGRHRQHHVSMRTSSVERAHRLVPRPGRLVSSLAARLRGLLLHPARPRHDDLPRCTHRGGDVRPPAHRGRRGLHRVAVGLQRQDLRVERRGDDLRHRGGAGVPGDRAERPRESSPWPRPPSWTTA